jgi:threonine synthase
MISPDEVVVVNCSGHTFPVEKQILGDALIRDMDVTHLTQPAIPHEGLLAALETVDTRVVKVVVIEDDPGASRLMTRILQSQGIAEVHQAYDGESGIDIVRQVMPDLVVLDLMMPGVDGFGVLDQLKADDHLADVPVVVVTAKDLTLEERSYLDGRVQSLLQKGSMIDEQVLQDLINRKLH